MKLDDTDRPLQLGEGRISGYLSIAFGTLSVLAVLCFMFPDYLTTPSLRVGYDLVLMRKLLAAGMVFSAGFGVLTFVLNRQKRLGALGILLTVLAAYLGGSSVEVGPRYDAPGFIGLDWFILDLLASAALFTALEKTVAHRRDQPILRSDFWHDGRYFIVNHLAIGIFLFMSVKAMPSLFSWTVNAGLQEWFGSLPGVVQFVAILVTADLMEYATHRAMHEVPALWRFHAVHHSVERMDWMAGSRLHFLEPLVTRTVVMLPAFVLGASDTPLLCYIVWAGFQAGLVHSNFGLEFGPLKYLVATPLFHHWHHSSEKEAIDTNYAAHLPMIDRLFGTYHMPRDRWPKKYGVAGAPLPKGMLRQFLYPFQRRQPPPTV
ncbi:sterol desaturase family protein [Paeniroseomonas aquatica]|uniref:Sterol desaturase family protein n=1 Tax=Paeniroseomonas aquatica TaxID=373043 RepID=A0ABT7ZZU2_9PROT|nr:sterol desaturase family protein [Paeniroseomonas aquatica]MDN3562989.1 sterol desaturase family protein [Paeniroseomonas aquatica]